MKDPQRLLIAFLLCIVGASAACALPGHWLPASALDRDGSIAFELQGNRGRPGPQTSLGIQDKPEGGSKLLSALWRSALLPGWGEHYLGAPARGYLFMGAEAATWGTYATFKTQEWLRLEHSKEMAEVFAGASGDHPDSYWRDVGQYENWMDYNEALRWDARREYGYGSDAYYDYIDENEISAEDSWEWLNEDRRIDYVLKRRASKNAAQRATNTLFALMVTRVVSLVDTWRLSNTRDRIQEIRQEQTGGLSSRVFPRGEGLALQVGWSRSF
jgi:hypothetical protein